MEESVNINRRHYTIFSKALCLFILFNPIWLCGHAALQIFAEIVHSTYLETGQYRSHTFIEVPRKTPVNYESMQMLATKYMRNTYILVAQPVFRHGKDEH